MMCFLILLFFLLLYMLPYFIVSLLACLLYLLACSLACCFTWLLGCLVVCLLGCFLPNLIAYLHVWLFAWLLASLSLVFLGIHPSNNIHTLCTGRAQIVYVHDWLAIILINNPIPPTPHNLDPDLLSLYSITPCCPAGRACVISQHWYGTTIRENFLHILSSYAKATCI